MTIVTQDEYWTMMSIIAECYCLRSFYTIETLPKYIPVDNVMVMMYWIINIGLAFLLCVFCSGFIIPKILLIAYKKNLLDEPDNRKIHHLAVPRLGGFAFKPVIFSP